MKLRHTTLALALFASVTSNAFANNNESAQVKLYGMIKPMPCTVSLTTLKEINYGNVTEKLKSSEQEMLELDKTDLPIQINCQSHNMALTKIEIADTSTSRNENNERLNFIYTDHENTRHPAGYYTVGYIADGNDMSNMNKEDPISVVNVNKQTSGSTNPTLMIQGHLYKSILNTISEETDFNGEMTITLKQ